MLSGALKKLSDFLTDKYMPLVKKGLKKKDFKMGINFNHLFLFLNSYFGILIVAFFIIKIVISTIDLFNKGSE